MATPLIILGLAAVTSDPITLAAGESAQLFMITDDGKMPVSEPRFEIDYQTDTGGWMTVYTLGSFGLISIVIPGKTTFRVRRLVAPASYSRAVGMNLG